MLTWRSLLARRGDGSASNDCREVRGQRRGTILSRTRIARTENVPR